MIQQVAQELTPPVAGEVGGVGTDHGRQHGLGRKVEFLVWDTAGKPGGEHAPEVLEQVALEDAHDLGCGRSVVDGGQQRVQVGKRVDDSQVLANHVGQETAQPSITLACEQEMTGFHETNYSLAYSSHLSWQSPDSPVPNELYPSLAWDNLFENRGSLRNTSILDRVKEDATQLNQQVSQADRAKLDEYLTSVRDVEKPSYRQVMRLE